MTRKHDSSRRQFIKTTVMGAIGSTVVSTGFPDIVPASVFGAYAPSNRINVGAIGTGRISRVHDLPAILRYDSARVMAVCDLDNKRVEDAKKLVNDYYSKQSGKPYDGVAGFADYRELLGAVDAVSVVTQTPAHFEIARDFLNAGAHVLLLSP